jgi:membrane protein DedA with SNARE-associated domain
MVPVVRSLVSFAAGIARMRLLPFTVFTFLGSLPWTAALVIAGYLLGENWETIGAWLKRFEYAVLAALVVAVVVFIWWQLGHPGWRRNADRPDPGTTA